MADLPPSLRYLHPTIQHDIRAHVAVRIAEEAARIADARVAEERERCARLAEELQALRNHVAHWRRAGVDDAALTRADDAIAAAIRGAANEGEKP